ncbi:MAG: hypothetical protein LBH43_11195 [Treponema sp.]|jgi:hypothetical protein|nr:hypothetical protein [Treponema sp.]
MNIQFDSDETYSVDGKTFHFSGKMLTEENFSIQIGMFLKALALAQENVIDIPHIEAVSEAIANTLMKNGCFVTIPTEYPPYDFTRQFCSEYRKARKETKEWLT